jgi:hypothetical protein
LGTAHLPTVVNRLSSGQTDYGCRADDATVRNVAGDYYTYVIGAESQRAAIDRVPGVTFLPFATDRTTPVYVLLLRDTLVNPAFAHSTANVTQTGDPAAAAAVMGAYYPRIVGLHPGHADQQRMPVLIVSVVVLSPTAASVQALWQPGPDGSMITRVVRPPVMWRSIDIQSVRGVNVMRRAYVPESRLKAGDERDSWIRASLCGGAASPRSSVMSSRSTG